MVNRERTSLGYFWLRTAYMLPTTLSASSFVGYALLSLHLRLSLLFLADNSRHLSVRGPVPR